MFGYIRYSKLDLTFRDFIKYKAYYCGVCKLIRKNFGQLNRLALNYDIVFIAILLSGVYGGSDDYAYENCILSPLRKKKIIYNEYIEYCSNINVLLFYYKLLDDYKDDKSVSALLCSKVFYKSYLKVKNMYPYKEKVFKEGLEKIQKLECGENTSLDELSDVFGQIFGEIFVYNDECKYSESLRKIGYYTGKLIYILDSYDDLEDDIKKNRFNLLIAYDNSSIHNEIEERVNYILNEIEQLTMEVEIKHSSGIIHNIVKLGLRNRAKTILKKGVHTT